MKKFIGDKKFYGMLFSIAFPIMIQNAITNFVGLLDNIMIGRLGTEPMSGVAIVNQLLFVYWLCLFGGLSGVGIYTAQYYGKGDKEGIKNTFRFKLWIGLFISIIATIIFLLYGSTLISGYLKGTNDAGNVASTLRYGKEYLAIILWMFPGVIISWVYTSTMRECSETFIPMISGIIAVFTNLFLNYLLIFGKFGFPKLGVRGGAIATVISRYVEAGFVVIWIILHKTKYEYFRGVYKKIFIPFGLVAKYFLTAMPLLINEGCWSLGVALLAKAYSTRGLNVVAGQNISSTINNIFNIAFIAMGDSVAIIVGKYLGAGDMKKARDIDNKIIATSIISAITFGGLMLIGAPFFPKIYNTTKEAKLIATHFIIVQSLFMPKDAFLHTSYFTIRAGGNTAITFLFDSVFMLGVSVPVAFALAKYTTLGAAMIFAIVHATDFLKCIVGFVLVKNGSWLKNLTDTSA